MLFTRLDHLPNELYLLIFDYFNPIDILYSFSKLNRRITKLIQSYSHLKIESIDLTKLNPFAFKYYCLEKHFHLKLKSLKLTDQQYKLIQFNPTNQLRQLNLSLENPIHFYSNEQVLLEKLQILIIEKNSFTWQKPFVNCFHLKQVQVHLKEHYQILDLLNHLPIVEKVHVTIDYDVTSCRENHSTEIENLSKNLNDFSYVINSKYGLVYFVTDYSFIELLIKQFVHLKSLRLYIVGCLNTIIDKNRLENNLFKYLPNLEDFHYYLQSYGGTRVKSMDEFRSLKWNFACYSNDMADMHFYFTLPFQFERVDECFDQYFLQQTKTNFTKSKNEIELEIQFGLTSIKHIDLTCSITFNLIVFLQKYFKSLKSIRFFSSTADYKSPPPLSQQSKYSMKTIETIIFDHTCKFQSAFIRLLPHLNRLIINQSLLNTLLEETGDGYLVQIKCLTVYSFQSHFIREIVSAFPNLVDLKLKTTLTDDEGPVRSFLDGRCIHKHRPVSLLDTLAEIFKEKCRKLKSIQIGCVFERAEMNIQSIISNLIRKHYNDKVHFHIQTEDFHSTQCGSTNILFF